MATHQGKIETEGYKQSLASQKKNHRKSTLTESL